MSELPTESSPGGTLPRDELLRVLVEESPDGIVLVDASGRILLVNPQIVQTFGYQREDLLGKPIEMLLPEEQQLAHRAHRSSFSRDARSRPMGAGLDLSARRSDGTSFPVEISLSALAGSDGPLVLATVRDVSEYRAIAEAREELARLRAVASVVSLHRSMTTALYHGQGLAGIAEAVQQVTGGVVVVEEIEGTSSARAGGTGVEPARSLAGSSRTPLRDAPHGHAFREGDRLVALACPDGEVLGAISLIDHGGAGEAEAFALEQAATVLAMELFRLRSIAETELRLWGDLTAELLDDDNVSRSRAHASALGYDIDRPHRVIFIDQGPSRSSGLLPAVRRIARRLALDRLLVTARATGLVLLVDRDLDWKELGEVVDEEAGGPHRIGVGGVHGPDGLRRSLAEAQLALRLSPALVASFDHLGVWRFLAADADPAGLQTFVREWIGVLVDYDTDHNAELVKTLAAYLFTSGALEATARRLHIHPSTLRYRLRRIQEVSGRDVHDPEQRFNLDLACRAHTTLAALSEDH